jgi:glycosyltransferase involved in cell wall biosynthesis
MIQPTALPSRIALVLPALNEAESVVSVVTAVAPYGQVIVVDDGSTDATGDLARAAGALVVTHVKNRGYDQALASGLQYAIDTGAEFVVTMDTDGQHQPGILADFLDRLESGADVVIGQRDRHQRFFESVFSVVASALWGVTDPLCGMKGYRLELFRGLPSLCTYPSIGTELTIRALRSGKRIDQVPVITLDRSGASRFGQGFRPNWRIFKAMIIGIFSARPLLPRR